MSNTVLDATLDMRIKSTSKRRFISVCKKEERTYTQVLRYLIDAYCEGRVKITPAKKGT